jgi:hypothetical protein
VKPSKRTLANFSGGPLACKAYLIDAHYLDGYGQTAVQVRTDWWPNIVPHWEMPINARPRAILQ